MKKLIIEIEPRIKTDRFVLVCLLVISLGWTNIADCNPIAFNPSAVPLIAIPPGGYPGPMMMAGHYDPYASMQTPYFMPASAYAAPWAAQFDVANRRSLPGLFSGGGGGAISGALKSERTTGGNRDRGHHNDEPSDEQKALDGIPLSLIEPDPPSSITERLSDSFSALGEGVKNHFRSISENFSDTMDDIRDAWRPAPAHNENSRRRRS